jgi:hypothetical protein
MYTLCGLGTACSIAEGKPSIARGQLLRREALELALYTFKYVDGIDSVIALMPVNLGDPKDETDDTSTALFLRRDDVAEALERPLTRTLPTAAPLTPGTPSPTDQANVDRLTRPHVYVYSHEAVADGVYLVLAPSTAA